MKNLIVALSLFISIGAYSQCKFVVADDVFFTCAEYAQSGNGPCGYEFDYQTTARVWPWQNNMYLNWNTNQCVVSPISVGWSDCLSCVTPNSIVFQPLSALVPGLRVYPTEPYWTNGDRTRPSSVLPVGIQYQATVIYLDWTRQGAPRVTYGKQPRDFNRYLSDGSRNPNSHASK